MKKIIFVLLLLTFSLAFSFADISEEKKKLYDYYISEGYKYHTMSLSGERYADDAIKMFEKACEIDTNSTSLAWLGSAWALKGNEASTVIKKMNYVLDGIDYLDRAVSLNEKDVLARRIRIETYDALPESVFNKSEVVNEDLRYLMKLFLTDKSCFDNQYDGAWAYYYYGFRLIKNGDLKNGKKYLQIAKQYVQDEELYKDIIKLLGGK